MGSQKASASTPFIIFLKPPVSLATARIVVICVDFIVSDKRSFRNLSDGGLLRRVRSGWGKCIPEIGNVDEGVVERGEDTGNAENELACGFIVNFCSCRWNSGFRVPSRI